MSIAKRVSKINPSFTLQMATKAADMRSKGIDVINFSVGEPDFNTPKHIRDAAKKALDEGYTKYTAAHVLHTPRSPRGDATRICCRSVAVALLLR